MKKKIYSTLIGLLSFVAVTQSQTTENRTIAPFSKLEVNGAANVEIVSYDSLFCTVTTEGKDGQNILITQEGDKLIINTSGLITGEHKVKLGCKGLTSVNVDGASVLESDIVYKTDNISINSNGAGKAKLMIEAQTAVIKTDGASSVRLKGSAEQLNITSDGASKVKGFFLVAQNANVKSDGTSNIIVNVKQSLTAKSDGVSKIYYAGNPLKKTLEKEGISKIEEYTEGMEKKNKSWNISSNGSGFKHWMGIGIAFNGYTNADLQTNLATQDDYMNLNFGKSIGWNLNLFEHDFHLWKNYINLCTGLGFEFDHYSFKNKITLNPDSSYVSASVNTAYNYKKNILKATYIEVPLILEFNTSKNAEKAFHIGAGAVFGYKMGSRTKQHYDNGGYDHYIVRKDDYNLNPFKMEAMAQIGYGRFTLYGNYSLTTLFQNNAGPQLYPFTIGLRIVPFD